MAICNRCGGRGEVQYASSYSRDMAFGVPEHEPLGRVPNVVDECSMCWGTGDSERQGTHPTARTVYVEGQDFIRHGDNTLVGEYLIPIRFPSKSKAWRYRWVTDEEIAKKLNGDFEVQGFWANFAGRASKQIAIPLSQEVEPPFWATHLFVRVIAPLKVEGEG